MNATTRPHAASPEEPGSNARTDPFSPADPDSRPGTDGAEFGAQEGRYHSLRVVAADGDPSAQGFYQAALPRLGHEPCIARTGPQMVELCRRFRPDLIIAEVGLPGMDGIAAAGEVCRYLPTPVVLVSASYQPLTVARALGNDCILACMAKPLDEACLGAVLAVAAARFGRLESLRAEAVWARQALKDRKVVEQAKGVIMDKAGVTEPEAFRRLRDLARASNRTMVDAAGAVLNIEEVFGPQSPATAQPRGRAPAMPRRGW